MVGKLQLVPSLAFELRGMLKSWQGHIRHQQGPNRSCGMGPGTSSTHSIVAGSAQTFSMMASVAGPATQGGAEGSFPA